MPAPLVGLAWSGGGLTGFFASMCATVALRELSAPGTMYSNSELPVAVNSGGTLGTILMANAPPGRLRFPPSWDPASYNYSSLSSRFQSGSDPEGSVWFAAIDNLVPSQHRQEADVYSRDNGSSWWLSALDVALGVYGLKQPLHAGPQPLTAGVSLLRQSATPIKRHPSSGVMLNAAGNLIPGEVDLNAGKLTAVGNGSAGFRPVADVGVLQGGSFSSAFWAAPIVELPSKLEFEAAKHALISAPGQPPSAGFWALDGGMVDTSGIAALLRRRVRSLVVFENKNSDLTAINSTFAFLFGVDTPTDTQNSLEGPRLAQVFPRAAWPAEPSENGLVNGSFHQLWRDLPVLANPYFGIPEPYVVERLLIVSNQLSTEFLDSFPLSSGIKAKLDDRWPNEFEVSMPPLDANALCVFSGWKVHKLAKLLREPFLTSR